jgi:peptidoglycan-associated lipoprotein
MAQTTTTTIALSAAAFAVLTVGCGPSYPNCDNDSNCHEGEYCVNGQCQACRADADCPAGQRCASGACEPITGFCQSNADCPDGRECQNNRCVAVAQSGEDLGSTSGSEGACELRPINFGFDQDELDASARNTIQTDVDCMRERGITAVHVTGYCDPRGTEEYNLALGDRRARAVMSYMISLGLDGNAVSASSMGEEMAQGTDEGSWARDRRVEVTAR